MKYSTKAGSALLAGLAGFILSAGSAAGLEENFNSFPVGSAIETQPGWSLGSNSQGIIREWTGSGDFGNYLEVSAINDANSGRAQWDVESFTGHVSISVDILPVAYQSGSLSIRRGSSEVAMVMFRGASNDIRAYYTGSEYGLIAGTGSWSLNDWYRVSIDLYLDKDTPANGRWAVSVYNLTDDQHVGNIGDLSLNSKEGEINSFWLQTSHSANSKYGFDNISVAVIPEAGTQAILFGALSLLVVTVFRFRRRSGNSKE